MNARSSFTMYCYIHYRRITFAVPSPAETNLKKQGMLPLTFDIESDYDKVQPSDHVSLLGLAELAPGKVS